jgi:hypothetical protein
MPIQINEDNDGKIIAVHASGVLTKTDYEHFVPEFERLVRQHEHLHLLFDMTGFHGWEGSAFFEEIKFDFKHFADIERLAIIGDKKWHHVVVAICEPFTIATSRYFDHTEAAGARKWLAEA